MERQIELRKALKQHLVQHTLLELFDTMNQLYAEMYGQLQEWNSKMNPVLEEVCAKEIPTETATEPVTEPVTETKKNTIVYPQNNPSLYLSKIPEEPRDKKELHREAILLKRTQLISEGKKPEDSLTEATLKKMIQDEGKTYWQIAEEIGCVDSVISSFAKSFGLQSKVSKLIGLKKSK